MNHLKTLTNLFPTAIEKSFQNDELAFLALTTKVESQLRDKIAWLFNQDVGSECLIIREWTGWNKARHDLVIVNRINQKLELIIEFKNQLGFVMRTNEYFKDFRKDLLRSAKTIKHRNEGDLEKSEILFVMHGRTLDITPNKYDPNVQQTVKYLKGAVTDCNKLTTQPIIFSEQFNLFKDHWEEWLHQACVSEDKILWVDQIKGGSYLNIGVKIITSIIGPFSAKEVFDLNTNCWHLP